MKFFFPLLIVLILVGAGVLIDSFFSPNGGLFSSNQTLGTLLWEDLAEYDFRSGIASKKLSGYDGKRVRIPGFAVPLGDNLERIEEFLLVPDPMSCIHVPPPPPNQIVHVKLTYEIEISQIYGPVWVEGKFDITKTQSLYGAAGFLLTSDKITSYQ